METAPLSHREHIWTADVPLTTAGPTHATLTPSRGHQGSEYSSTDSVQLELNVALLR